MALHLTRKLSKTSIFFITLVSLLIIARIILPSVILHYGNIYLYDKVPGYTGHMGDFDLSILRGAYTIKEFKFEKKDGKVATPFIDIGNADIRIAWPALFRGHVLANLVLTDAKLNFVDSKDKSKKQFGVDASNGKKSVKDNDAVSGFVDVYNKLVPLNLESLKLVNGEIHFKNGDGDKAIEASISKVELEALNIHNSTGESKKLFSSYKLTGVAEKTAKIKSNGTFNILETPLDFDINGELTGLDLKRLNPLMVHYGPFTFEKGTGSVFLEVASKNGKVAGYVKPVLHDAKLMGDEKDFVSFKQFGYEVAIGTINAIFKNSTDKNTATKLEFAGDMTKPKFDYWKAIKVAFVNGFGKPDIKPKLDNDISLKSVDEKNKGGGTLAENKRKESADKKKEQDKKEQAEKDNKNYHRENITDQKH